MSESTPLHLVVAYKEDKINRTKSYAVSEQVLQEAELWEATAKEVCAKNLVGWLHEHGCKLDCQDGPAVIARGDDGSMYEEYYRDGKLDRRDGPAITVRTPNGSTCMLAYCRDGKYVAKENLVPLSTIRGVTVRGGRFSHTP